MCGLLAPFGQFRQPIADLVTIKANIAQLPVAETSQESQICLALTMSDSSSNPAIDQPGESPCKISDRFPNRGPGCGMS
jgi:hypothetical protein